jgi:hypothetical protein
LIRNLEVPNFQAQVLCLALYTIGACCSALQACTLERWDVSDGAIAVGTPGDIVNPVPRVERFCGLEVTGAGYVQDNSPVDELDTRIRLRFYVLANAGEDEVVILEAYQDDSASSLAFSISLKPSSGEVGFTSAGTSTHYNPSVSVAHWVLIEVDWEAGGNLRYWVNDSPGAGDDDQTGSIAAGSATHVGMVRLGAPAGIGDITTIHFDAYQANRTTAVGGLLIGDANQDGGLEISDIDQVKHEILRLSESPELPETWLSPGQPDCNNSGAITPADLTCIKNLILDL